MSARGLEAASQFASLTRPDTFGADAFLDRVFVLAVEVLELERLLELLEQQLDLPPGLVQIRNRRRRPLEVVRQDTTIP